MTHKQFELVSEINGVTLTYKSVDEEAYAATDPVGHCIFGQS